MVDIVNSSFVTSAANIKQAPQDSMLSEIVFLARSNVGKSSLLNTLSNNSSLAKVSSTPGKTRLINFFNVTFMDRDNSTKLNAMFVDLPGFGYAKVSKSLKDEWEETLSDFILKREQIKIFLHLIDSRHTNLDIDATVGDYVQSIKKPHQHILKVFTKLDKLSQNEISALKRAYPDAIMVSSAKKRGLAGLNQALYNILNEDIV